MWDLTPGSCQCLAPAHSGRDIGFMENCELKYEIVGLMHDSMELVDEIDVMHD